VHGRLAVPSRAVGALAGRRVLGGLSLSIVVLAMAGCGGGTDGGGLSAADRNAAQTAMNTLQGSNIPTQLVDLTATAGLVPAACQLHLVSRSPYTFDVYVFWIPFVGPQSYSWLSMRIGADPTNDRFHLGTAPAVLSGGGVQLGNGVTVPPTFADYDPLSAFGPRQNAINRRVMRAHSGDAFARPEGRCQVLKNGDLRFEPDR
jgi:hypothetical protein